MPLFRRRPKHDSCHVEMHGPNYVHLVLTFRDAAQARALHDRFQAGLRAGGKITIGLDAAYQIVMSDDDQGQV